MACAMDLWRQSFWAVRNVYVGEGTLMHSAYAELLRLTQMLINLTANGFPDPWNGHAAPCSSADKKTLLHQAIAPDGTWS